jgi:transcription elongation GreA/GreB family factor
MTSGAGLARREQIRQQVLAALEDQRQLIARAVAEAASATTHADARQEGKYDTRAIETSYLAGAQAERLQELAQKIQTIERIAFREPDPNQAVRATSLICAQDESGTDFWYMILPGAGGLTVTTGEITVTILAPESPLGLEFLGKSAGDEISVRRGDSERIMTLTDVQ